MDNAALTQGMQQALDQSKKNDSMKQTADFLTKTAKVLSAGHLDPTLISKAMEMLEELMPEPPAQETPQEAPPQGQYSMGMEM